MLLLTDRLSEGLRLQKILSRLRPCTVLALHHALMHPAGHSIIICDVALDNVTSNELLRAALAHHRTGAIPVLCLTRDPSDVTLQQAYAIGATATLLYQAPAPQLIAAIEQLTKPVAAAPAVADPEAPARKLQASIREAGLALGELLEAAKRHNAISAATLDRGANAVIAAIGQAHIRAWLDIVWNYDDATYQHCLLVAGLTAAFAAKLGLSLSSQRLLSQAALVHDIGKAHIPHAILNKSGPLSPAETKVMRTHAVVGHQTLVSQRGLDPRLLDVVRHHHEYLDGSGYPDGLHGAQISQFVRIVTVCDIYAALIERRSYKAPMPPYKALNILADMAGQLDRNLVAAFNEVMQAA